MSLALPDRPLQPSNLGRLAASWRAVAPPKVLLFCFMVGSPVDFRRRSRSVDRLPYANRPRHRIRRDHAPVWIPPLRKALAAVKLADCLPSRRRQIALLVFVCTLLLSAAPTSAAQPITPQQAIGWKLFFDPILSRPNNVSCATCHDPQKGYEDGQARGEGAHGDRLGRNTPTVVNLSDAEFFFWDGRAGSLVEQAAGPIENPLEMDLPLSEAIRRVRSQKHYRRAFKQAGIGKIDQDAMLEAIAAFESRLETGPTLFDRWINGDRSALNEQQERGRHLFFTKGDCAMCHNGLHLTDGDFHNVGTGTPDDIGRAAVEDDEYFLGAFKTPALRNWKGREPFLHDGRFATVREVIEFYVSPPPTLVGEREIAPIPLSPGEIDDLIVFLETLNGGWPDLEPFERAWTELQTK